MCFRRFAAEEVQLQKALARTDFLADALGYDEAYNSLFFKRDHDPKDRGGRLSFAFACFLARIHRL
jgi:hypothetical protein